MNILHRLSYGWFADFHNPMLANAFCLNAVLNVYFYRRTTPKKHLYYLVAGTLLLTLVGYATVPEAIGTSTVWSFLYGYHGSKRNVDHYVYWMACVSCFVPFVLDNKLVHLIGFRLWPWPKRCIIICNLAHAGFAGLGYAVNRLQSHYTEKIK